jgi:hypothetical protein
MKLNWGTGLVIALVLFALFIGYFFVRGMQNPSDLVAPDYYDQEIKFQDQIDGRNRAKQIGNIILEPVDDYLAITFPEGFDGSKASGTIQFYKPDNANLDRVYTLKVNTANQHLIDLDELIRGRWDIKVNATVNEEGYYWEETINL